MGKVLCGDASDGKTAPAAGEHHGPVWSVSSGVPTGGGWPPVVVGRQRGAGLLFRVGCPQWGALDACKGWRVCSMQIAGIRSGIGHQWRESDGRLALVDLRAERCGGCEKTIRGRLQALKVSQMGAGSPVRDDGPSGSGMCTAANTCAPESATALRALNITAARGMDRGQKGRCAPWGPGRQNEAEGGEPADPRAGQIEL